ncbi:MAG: UvrD-helicase domain-containing protein [Woeseiaceae bacterium]|nr:UvrD-helicase domain-containing protein [Woeseiaceae bacterium]
MNAERALPDADRRAREQALDVAHSFIVQAPAGSGKTELLIQRYLKLLATVDEPEEILAITFTRKAAAEMRLRVIEALQRAARGERPDEPHLRVTAVAAEEALRRDRERGWQLIAQPRRMRVQTLDSLNAAIARQRPITQASAGNFSTILEDSKLDELYRDAAAATFDYLRDADRNAEATRSVLLHVDINTRRYVDYLARMLRTRDQWLPFVSAGLDAPENADALRAALESNLRTAIAQQLAGLYDAVPADIAAGLRELGSHAAGQLASAGNDSSPIVALAQVPAGGVDGNDVESLVQHICWWRGAAELLLTGGGSPRKTLTRNQGFPAGKDERKASMYALLQSLGDYSEFGGQLHRARELPPPRYSDAQWIILLSLFRLLPLAVAELQRLGVMRGVTDHIEVSLSAADALGSADEPGDVALLLDYQVRHILVDEMQDTSRPQYRMLEALTGGWTGGDGRTLFCVGDPMQSIYRFRNAEVSQFLLARDKGIGPVALQPLLLRRNFRSAAALVDWFNATFARILPARDDAFSGAVSYSDSVAGDAPLSRGGVHIYPQIGASVDGEANAACATISSLYKTHRNDTIAVLVRGRTQLPALLRRLRSAGIPYQAVDIDRLSDLPEIIDVLALTRAFAHLGDRVAWLALLRSPWVGLDWHDLHALVYEAANASVWELITDPERMNELSSFGQNAIRRFADLVAPLLSPDRSVTLRERVEQAWFVLGGPALAGSSDAVGNVYHFFDVLADREDGGSIADVAAIAEQLDEVHVASSAPSRLQIMTMHKSKGLQFDHVVLYGLGRTPGSSRKTVLSWLDLPDEHGAEEKVISPVGPDEALEHDPIHRYIERSEAIKSAHEQGRLLYVACTRAKRSLHLFGHVGVSASGDEIRKPPKNSLLSLLWPVVEPLFRAAHDAGIAVEADDGDALSAPPLRRFDGPWTLPAVDSPAPDGAAPPASSTRVDYDWVGFDARLAGTVVHRWLQLAASGKVDLDADEASERRVASGRWLRELGAAEDDTGTICERVELALHNVRRDRTGRWLIDGPGECELALSGIYRGDVDAIVIDRVRIDDEGVHWIVDYKTSTHEGGDLEGFLEAESERYRPQLEKYACIYRSYSGAPVRCALYFPLLQRFVEVDVRD